MARSTLVGVALAVACVAGQATAAAPAATPAVRTAHFRVHNTTPRPAELRLVVQAGATERDEGNYIAVAHVARDGVHPRRLVAIRLLDLAPTPGPLCGPDAALCRAGGDDGRHTYTHTSTVVDRFEEFLVAVRGVDPKVEVRGNGWAVSPARLTVLQRATRDAGGARAKTAFDPAYERFVGAPASHAGRESFAYAMLPCDRAGTGSAVLRSSDGPSLPVGCGREVVAHSRTGAAWSLVGEAEGLTHTYTRLLVIGLP